MKTSLKKVISRLILALFTINIAVPSSHAIDIPTGPVNFGNLATILAQLNSADLVIWRTGAVNDDPKPATQMTFQYLTSGTNLAIPSRTAPADDSANADGFIWSDNAIKIDAKGGNKPNMAVVIYTNNPVAKEGGLVNATNDSVLPLIWKAVELKDLKAISGAKVDGSSKVSGPLFMPSYISAATGGTCPVEGSYTGIKRDNNGFCDASTHFALDKDQPGSLFDKTLDAAKLDAVFRYMTVVGARGVGVTERGTGPRFNPVYLTLGVGAADAIPDVYQTTITVELQSH